MPSYMAQWPCSKRKKRRKKTSPNVVGWILLSILNTLGLIFPDNIRDPINEKRKFFSINIDKVDKKTCRHCIANDLRLAILHKKFGGELQEFDSGIRLYERIGQTPASPYLQSCQQALQNTGYPAGSPEESERKAGINILKNINGLYLEFTPPSIKIAKDTTSYPSCYHDIVMQRVTCCPGVNKHGTFDEIFHAKEVPLDIYRYKESTRTLEANYIDQEFWTNQTYQRQDRSGNFFIQHLILLGVTISAFAIGWLKQGGKSLVATFEPQVEALLNIKFKNSIPKALADQIHKINNLADRLVAIIKYNVTKPAPQNKAPASKNIKKKKAGPPPQKNSPKPGPNKNKKNIYFHKDRNRVNKVQKVFGTLDMAVINDKLRQWGTNLTGALDYTPPQWKRKNNNKGQGFTRSPPKSRGNRKY